MPLPIQKFREAVLQLLYSFDFAPQPEEVVSLMMEGLKTTRKTIQEALLRVEEIRGKLPEIDLLITNASKEYRFERITRMEKTILRLGLFELLFDEKIPEKVSIAEAIRLTRKFGTRESAQFVNAILDGINQSSVGK